MYTLSRETLTPQVKCANFSRENSPGVRLPRKKGSVCIAGGANQPSSSEFRELSESPAMYACQLMGVTRALMGVAAGTAFLNLVWPMRGPVALAGEPYSLTLA